MYKLFEIDRFIAINFWQLIDWKFLISTSPNICLVIWLNGVHYYVFLEYVTSIYGHKPFWSPACLFLCNIGLNSLAHSIDCLSLVIAVAVARVQNKWPRNLLNICAKLYGKSDLYSRNHNERHVERTNERTNKQTDSLDHNTSYGRNEYGYNTNSCVYMSKWTPPIIDKIRETCVYPSGYFDHDIAVDLL